MSDEIDPVIFATISSGRGTFLTVKIEDFLCLFVATATSWAPGSMIITGYRVQYS